MSVLEELCRSEGLLTIVVSLLIISHREGPQVAFVVSLTFCDSKVALLKSAFAIWIDWINVDSGLGDDSMHLEVTSALDVLEQDGTSVV